MFQRCCSLASIARPAATGLIARFVSRGDGPRRCVSKEGEKGFEKASSELSILSKRTKTDDGNYALELLPNLNLAGKINTIPSACEDYLDDGDVKPPHALEECTEDLSYIGSPLTPTFSFAKYANKSRTIKELVKLGVSLYKFEARDGMVEYILGLDYEQDVKPYIRFLHDCGVPAEYLGEFITKNPEIFKQDMDDLHTRIRYLRAHNFSMQMIKDIICKNPKWLLYTTKDIDNRLSYFQSTFKLNGHEVRTLTHKAPKVVTYRMVHLLENTFSIKEEMGFDQQQVKTLLLVVPRVWIKNRDRLLSTFEYANHVMQLKHDFIVQMPQILFCRKSRLEQRHLFLVAMKKAQYDPLKPMYVSPRALISGTDLEFCRDIAKTSVEIYNQFLKTF